MIESAWMANALLRKILPKILNPSQMISAMWYTVIRVANSIQNSITIDRVALAPCNTWSDDRTDRDSNTQNANHCRNGDGIEGNGACESGKLPLQRIANTLDLADKWGVFSLEWVQTRPTHRISTATHSTTFHRRFWSRLTRWNTKNREIDTIGQYSSTKRMSNCYSMQHRIEMVKGERKWASPLDRYAKIHLTHHGTVTWQQQNTD